MSAQDYTVNFPYGATSDPYSLSRPHKGDDRPCPEGTPVTINGQQIGLTGATGYVFGAHLHIQEWNGSYGNVRKPQNAFKPGKVINVDRNATQGDRSFGKFIDVQNADGWVDSYCHLSRIDVNVGDIIGGNMSSNSIDEAETDVLRIGHSEAGGWNLAEVHAGKYDKLFVDTYRGQSVSYFLRKQWENSAAWRDKRQAALNYFATKTQTDAQIKASQEQIKSLTADAEAKNKTIVDLTKKLAESQTPSNGMPQETIDQIKETNAIVKWIKDLLGRVFK